MGRFQSHRKTHGHGARHGSSAKEETHLPRAQFI
ncbi:predicted protein [Plenodomus lingam JN3]|uniref:Predicted protein n=1 Tax=Leptosphaeria maculans (strain JN3 / isolate v23.1.3 / race Av1-4-5-6-7-8) TaxID=985895 RepID=E5ADH1_LEPMJ|nr:predicted protein [Plenodomus lingam JN3]CBY01260.1 predicted protein [Plenodomus lingam JN3]